MSNGNNPLTIFTGNANPEFAARVAHQMGLSIGKAHVGRFSDGEIQVEILENVRGHDVFIIQPTPAPASENLMELVLMADALRRASAHSITAVVPYFGYARQDRRIRSARVPITAKVVADMLATVGICRLVTIDLHAEQIQGFFDMPVDNVYASPILISDIDSRITDGNVVVVSPDVGGVVRARAIAKRLHDADLAIIDKRRPRENESQVMNVIGDVSGKTCIIVDDIVDTAGTLCTAAKALKDRGAREVVAYCTHPVLSGRAVETIAASALNEIVVSDTIMLSDAALKCPKIRQISLTPLLSEAIRRIHGAESLSSMFTE